MHLKTIIGRKGQILKILLLAIMTVALTGGIALYHFLSVPDAPRNRKAEQQPTYRMQIDGLRFYGMNQGRRVVSIEADRFTLARGKIGFLSIGLTRKAVIENATIDLYAGAPPSSGEGPGQRSGRNPSGALSRTHNPVKTPPSGEFDFRALFAEETFSSLFPVRNIAEIEVSPVKVRLHAGEAVLIQITAARASVRLKERAILFTGQVRVSSDGAEMTTEQLVFHPETARLWTEGPFVLKSGNRTLEGSNLTTDLSLSPR